MSGRGAQTLKRLERGVSDKNVRELHLLLNLSVYADADATKAEKTASVV